MLRTACLAATAWVALAFPSQESIAFAPVPGTRVAKVFEVRSHLNLDGASLVMDGEHSDVPLSIESTVETRLAVRDTYAEVGAGRSLRLERQYDDLGARAVTRSEAEMTGGGSSEVASATPLAGRAVRFEWDQAAGRHTRRFADEETAPDEAEAALLAGLEEDLDFRAFLPSRSVAVGDRWQIDPAAMAALLTPGGDLGLAPTDPDQAAEVARLGGAEGLARLLGAPTGTIEGRLVSVEGPATARLARVEFTFDLRFVRELDDAAWPPFVDPAPPGDQPVEAKLRSTRLDALLDQASATLVFGLDSGRFESFEFEAEFDVALDQSLTLSLGDQDLDVRLALEFTLVQALRATATAN
jgi:hypothetical protein